MAVSLRVFADSWTGSKRHVSCEGPNYSSEAFMSNPGRSIIFPILVSVSMGYSPPITAQSRMLKSEARAGRTSIDGKFGHYLESPTGAIDGIVFEDGTVARFPLFALAPESAFFRPGDAIRVEGDGFSSLTGPVLLNASAMRSHGGFIRAGVAPVLATIAPRPNLRPHRGPQRVAATSKAQSQTTDPRLRANGSLFIDGTRVRPGKKAPRETLWLRKGSPKAVRGDVGNNLQWTRAEETSGQ
jgi:hypothetical protein